MEQHRRDVEAVWSQTVPQGKEGEELDIVLDQELEQDPPKAVWPKDAADLEVEQQVEHPVEKEDDEEGQGHMESEVVHSAAHKQVVLPFFRHVCGVGLPVVEVELLDRRLNGLLGIFHSSDFPLLLFDELDRLKDGQSSAVVLVAVVVVQP